MSEVIWKQPEIVRWSQRLLDSYEQLLGRSLIERKGSIQEQAQSLFLVPFVVVSHGIQSDPIFNYGNQTALDLWEITWQELTQTPSRLTAEPPNQEERQKLLRQVTEKGYIEHYQGIRISRTGKRFLIKDVTVWNMLNDGRYIGQAATYRHWSFL